MKLLGTLLLCCVILVNGQDDGAVLEAKTEAPHPPPEPTTTQEPPKTTEPPTTTAPTTLAPPPAPPAPSPTPSPSKPIPDYPQNRGKWSVEDKPGKNTTCILLQGALQLIVKDQNRTVSLSVPPFAVASGSCKEPQSITLTWNSTILNHNGTAYENNSLTLYFESNQTKGHLSASSGISEGKYALQNITASVYLSKTATNVDLNEKAVFQTPLNHSYSCIAEETIRSDGGDLSVKFKDVHLEAYRSYSSGHSEFSAAIDCPADDATDVVPIAVGAALAGLVVVVLIAYLIGRKRSRSRGYQSV